MIQGCGTALVTPFHKDLSLAEGTLRKLVRRQIDAGIDFVVPCGTTGEGPTLTDEEHRRVVEIVIEEAAGRLPVIAGAGGYDTVQVIRRARELEKMGANGILSVAPYYNKPSQEGLFQHYRAIASSIRIPILVYNVPGRTGVNVEPGTLARLAEIENIVGVKEASGSITQIAALLNQVPENFAIFSGDDALTLPVIALGGKGVISTAGNEIPAEMTELVRRCLAGDFAAARKIHRKYLPLMNVNFVESNPIPVKAAMAMMGLLEPIWRLPLVPPGAASHARIEEVLLDLTLLERNYAENQDRRTV